MENFNEDIMKEKPSKKPRPEASKVKELKRQTPPTDSKNELPIDEGYSKTFLRVVIAVSVFLISITLSGVLGINSMFENSRKQIVSNFTVQIIPLLF